MINVLIVDDSGVMRALLRSIIRSEHFNVIGEAGDGVKALEMTERLKPELVCLDIEMPEMSGLETLRELKSKHPNLIVVMVTASNAAADVQDALKGGADGYILKPYNVGKVLDTLYNACEKAQARNN